MQQTPKNSSQTQTDLSVAAQKVEVTQKLPFTEPKLTFVEPKLIKHGNVADVTEAFFGTFIP